MSGNIYAGTSLFCRNDSKLGRLNPTVKGETERTPVDGHKEFATKSYVSLKCVFRTKV